MPGHAGQAERCKCGHSMFDHCLNSKTGLREQCSGCVGCARHNMVGSTGYVVRDTPGNAHTYRECRCPGYKPAGLDNRKRAANA